MLNEISFLNLQGTVFSELTELPILDSADGKYTKVSLLYGRNGTGKSTIARGFRKIKGESISTVSSAFSSNEQKQKIILTEELKKNVFVFDEDFISSNILIEESGLGSIVMLGEQADLTKQIEAAESNLKVAEDLVKTTENTFQEYKVSTNPKSPKFYSSKIYSALQRDDGWAGRDSKARGLRQNSRVSDDTYKKFIPLIPQKSRDELVIDYDEKFKELTAAKNGTSTIAADVPSIPDKYNYLSIELANELLKQRIEKPELTSREKYLLSLVTDGKANELQERLDYLSDEGTSYCPYCLHDITPDYKEKLIAQIQKILNDEVKLHQTQLNAQKIDELIIDLSDFAVLPSYTYCTELLRKTNEILNGNNSLLQEKIDDLYSPIVDRELSEASDLITELQDALNKLKEEKTTHNSEVKNTRPIIDELVSINNQIAYYDVISYSEQYDLQKEEMDAAEEAFNKAVQYRDEIKKNLEDFNGKRKCIDIAIDVINNGLKYIFFSENRLSLKQDGDFYVLYSNGKSVLPKNVSVGERNIIGLCYFFTTLMAGKRKDAAYNGEYLIVIDDPVSSYDFENKIGILSFLKYKLGQFLGGNINTRAIIMTHDLLTLFDIEKICQEFSSTWKRTFAGRQMKYQLWELKNCCLTRFEYKKRQEYTELIRLVYEYGRGEASEYDVVIGNIMRQTLEAFSTFEYKKGIAEVSTDDVVLAQMCDEHKAYFKNLMYRIVLNNGSHKEEQVQSMEVDFLSVISEEEKRRTAKEIICFIYLLNKAHVLSHLGDVRSLVDTWCDEVKARAAII